MAYDNKHRTKIQGAQLPEFTLFIANFESASFPRTAKKQTTQNATRSVLINNKGKKNGPKKVGKKLKNINLIR